MAMTDSPRWLELSLEADAELAEAISEALFPYVEGGVALEQTHRHPLGGEIASRWEDERAEGPIIVRAYLPDDETLAERKRKVEEVLAYLNMVRPTPQPTYRIVAQSDWADAWKASFKPLRIGRRILIRPSWINDVPSDHGADRDLVITLDPGMAFGTGLHPTTQLCAAAMEDYVQAGMRVLDVGSGSGILSILAAKLGAREVVGVDTDDEAVRAGRENVLANGVGDRVTIAHGSHEVAHGVYDLVVVNILAGVIIRMLAEGLASRAPRFIFSGILDAQASDVARAAEAAGLSITEQRAMNDWIGLVCTRRSKDR
ncbi:50S ribosomal protein L11 methyltransferase [Candidatus Roseilinea sp. NK_OTU-006]|jgi:ribosomal protein L11 methyltransferase|uniref:50S ribosomal protein L11 methyltransferase n=1 Tax=Candidatus Roseilinea sp. NK_OTU-006 TaxID=2704250 RepID=UPI00145C7D15|nr:50S ribosomal protein L11 methyltransferase [Candidatus Roseilinea sp. NK_OTU-006]